MEMRHWMRLIEAVVIDFNQKKKALRPEKPAKNEPPSTSDALHDYVDAVKGMIDHAAEEYQIEGKWKKFLDDYDNTGAIPEFEVRVKFDSTKVSPEERQILRRQGFSEDSWMPGFSIYDDPHTGSWMNDALDWKKPGAPRTRKNPSNYYQYRSFTKTVSPTNAMQLFTNRDDPQTKQMLGLFNNVSQGTEIDTSFGRNVFRYNKLDLKKVRGRWDIRTHPRHNEMYHGNKRWYINLRNNEHSSSPNDDEEMREAFMVMKTILQAEQMKKSSPQSVKSLPRFKPSGGKPGKQL